MPFINVKTNASLTKEKKEIIKRRLFDSISDYCYVKFEESKYWGYNGFMF